MARYHLLLLFFAFAALPSFAQIADNFTDGNLTDSPAWQGNNDHFIVNPDLQLQLNAPAAGISQLYLPTAIADSAVWELYFKLDFAPSNTNSLHIVLQSDQLDLLSGNGYYLFMGETGSNDAIQFFRMDNGAPLLLATATLGAVANVPTVRVRLEKKPGGQWTLLTDYTGGQNFQQEFEIMDATHPGGDLFFGLRCLYTATRTDKFFFDDILVAPLLPDIQPPALLAVAAVSGTEVDVRFDEKLDEAAATDPTNYGINNGIGQPVAAILDPADRALVHLLLQVPLASPNDYLLTVENMADLSGNVSASQTAAFSYFVPDQADEFDILLNEIMADPSPVVTLPNIEFVELYNRSDKTFDLNGFGLSSGGAPQVFPPFILRPKSYVLVCANANVDSLVPYGDVVGLSSFPALVNTGDEITLTSPSGSIIHFVAYTTGTYRNDQKAEGGWTLELVNPFAVCRGEANWRSSESLLGGSPGQPNSVLVETPDSQAPTLLRAFASVAQPDVVTLFFDKILDKTTAGDAGSYSISNGAQVADAALLPPTHDAVRLQLAAPLVPSVIYEINATVADCAGIGGGAGNEATIALPEEAEPMDIIINEVLFDPVVDGADFVEVFNRSAKVLNLGDLVIGNIQPGKDTVLRSVTTNKLFFPGEFAAFTTDPAGVAAFYEIKNPSALLQNDLPAFNNDEGNVTLLRGNITEAVILDAFDYHEDYHHPLLDNPDGVSLERLNPNAPTQDPHNWHSAAARLGYATPTYQNSQALPDPPPTSNLFEITEKKLSPDGDGFQDFLLIQYKTDGPGYTAQVKIFDTEGRLVKTLVNNDLLATEGFLRWDGDTDGGDKARIGIYVVWAQATLPDGTVSVFKDTCVVAGRL